jgi:hypothetical protein
MALPSLNSLTRRAEDMANRHTHGLLPIGRPPAVTAQSPLHELLIAEVAAALPPVLGQKLRACPDVGRVQDWLTAGALYGLVANDPVLAKKFLAELGDDPRQATQALLRAQANRMAPPVRNDDWHRHDRRGLALQLGVAVGLLAFRALLFAGLALWAGLTAWDLALPLRGLASVDFFAGGAGSPGITIWAFGIAGAWLTVEALAGPWALEQCRQLPARQAGAFAPLSWRVDAFHVFWYGQATLLLVLLAGRYAWLQVATLWASGWSGYPWVRGVFVALAFAYLVAITWAEGMSVLKIGTDEGRL